MAQTNFGYMSKGRHGTLANGIKPDVVTGYVEPADGFGFGICLQRGSADGKVKPLQAGGTPYGISINKNIVPMSVTGNVVKNELDRPVDIARYAYMYIKAPEAVKASDKVYAVPGTGVLTNIATDNIELPLCSWEETVAKNEISTIRIRL